MSCKKLKLYYPYFYAAITATIVGCGGDSGSSNNNNSEQHIIIETRPAVEESDVDSLSTIDLSDAVKTQENVELRLESITPLSEHNRCSVISTKGLSYSVETDISQVCRFEYTVVPVEAQYSGKGYGISEVQVSDNGSERLAPIVETAIQGEEIAIHLNGYLPSGAELDSSSLELRGVTQSGDLGSVTATNNVINYTAPNDTSGQVQIYYSALNEATGMLYSGIVYVAVSLNANSAPTAELNTLLEERYLAEGRIFAIDVSSYISDPDGDDLQVTDVYTGENAWAEVVPNSTQMVYRADNVGYHHLTYVVSDRRGGYAIGTLSFTVKAYSSIYDSATEKTFLPTLLFEQLEVTGGIYTDTFGEDGTQGAAGYYPVFERTLAESYCLTRGAFLPTTSELSALFNGELGGQSVWSSEYKWPSGSDYVTQDGSISLYDGVVGTAATGYVSCVQKNLLPNQYSFSNQYASTEWDTPVLVSATATQNDHQYPLPVEKYSLQTEVVSTNPTGLESEVEVTVDGNNVTVTQLNDMVQSATVKITDPSVQGANDEMQILVGLNECPQDTTVEDTQVLGCIPVIYGVDGEPLSDGIAFSAAMSDAIFERLGINLYQDRPYYFRSSNTVPNYTYLDPELLFYEKIMSWDEYESAASLHQSLCDLMNFAQISGRQNWTLGQPTYYSTNPSLQSWQGTFAEELTNWMSAQTGYSDVIVGQGYLVNNNGRVLQLNQADHQNKGRYQGGYPFTLNYNQWQFLTCVSLSP